MHPKNALPAEAGARPRTLLCALGCHLGYCSHPSACAPSDPGGLVRAICPEYAPQAEHSPQRPTRAPRPRTLSSCCARPALAADSPLPLRAPAPLAHALVVILTAAEEELLIAVDVCAVVLIVRAGVASLVLVLPFAVVVVLGLWFLCRGHPGNALLPPTAMLLCHHHGRSTRELSVHGRLLQGVRDRTLRVSIFHRPNRYRLRTLLPATRLVLEGHENPPVLLLQQQHLLPPPPRPLKRCT
ncbi:hypothetical protein FB451DRAFT_1394321 [Mycena latifolia]|nr:hypothetical protein FB451DRAFT_1394321 [Mycena latifolia]